MSRFNQYGKDGRVPIPCATCAMPSTHWFADGSPAWPPHTHDSPRPYYRDELVTLHHDDYANVTLPTNGLLVMDPPFDLWETVTPPRAETVIAFTTWQYREHVERLFGKPRAELVWSFDVGRWVSHSMPLVAHETILVFGTTGSSYVGDATDGVARDKGSGSVGKDTYPTRTYTPHDRKALTSVLPYPRQTRSKFGIWEKPLPMIQRLIAWAAPSVVVDPFSGSGSSLVAAKSLGIPSVGVDIDERACRIAADRCRQEVLGLSA